MTICLFNLDKEKLEYLCKYYTWELENLKQLANCWQIFDTNVHQFADAVMEFYLDWR